MVTIVILLALIVLLIHGLYVQSRLVSARKSIKILEDKLPKSINWVYGQVKDVEVKLNSHKKITMTQEKRLFESTKMAHQRIEVIEEKIGS